MATILEFHEWLTEMLDEIKAVLPEGIELTLMGRDPETDEVFFLLSNDDYDAVAAAILRMKEPPPGSHIVDMRKAHG